MLFIATNVMKGITLSLNLFSCKLLLFHEGNAKQAAENILFGLRATTLSVFLINFDSQSPNSCFSSQNVIKCFGKRQNFARWTIYLATTFPAYKRLHLLLALTFPFLSRVLLSQEQINCFHSAQSVFLHVDSRHDNNSQTRVI